MVTMKKLLFDYLSTSFRIFSKYLDICPSWIRIGRFRWTNGYIYQSDIMDSYEVREGVRRYLKKIKNEIHIPIESL